jgi:cation:H+ antiporter
MLLDLGLLALGGAMLYFGAEWLVRGAAGLALALGVRPLLIGLTIVSYGTSAPELAVSMLAAADGKSEIALGNVVGSNIANIGLILGLTALIAPPKSDGSMARRELLVMLAATAALPLVLLDDTISRSEAILFVLGSVGFTYAAYRWSKLGSGEPTGELPDEIPQTTSKPALVGLVVVGLAVLLGGGRAFVSGAVGIAFEIGMSERVVGLTVVALGTSLPELAASLVAAMRGHSELALGNVVGSNVFNILLILGITGSVLPVTGSLDAMRVDLVAVGLLTLFCAWTMRKPRVISRAEGAVMLAGYVGFLVVLKASG